MKINFNPRLYTGKNIVSGRKINELKQNNFNKNNKVNDSANRFNNAYVTNISFTGLKQKSDFQLNLSSAELKKRTSADALMTKTMLDENAECYKVLAEGDKESLKHLVRAAEILGNVQKQLDNPNNIPFEKYLESEIAKGNEDAKMTKVLYDAQIGMNGTDRESNAVELAKGHSQKPGRGFYPEDLERDEFHSILIKMLNGDIIILILKIILNTDMMKILSVF